MKTTINEFVADMNEHIKEMESELEQVFKLGGSETIVQASAVCAIANGLAAIVLLIEARLPVVEP